MFDFIEDLDIKSVVIGAALGGAVTGMACWLMSDDDEDKNGKKESKKDKEDK